MKRFEVIIIFVVFIVTTSQSLAEGIMVFSPDKKLNVELTINSGRVYYTVNYNGKTMLEASPLGLVTSVGDFSKEMSMVGKTETKKDETYSVDRIKESSSDYKANGAVLRFVNRENKAIDIVFSVGNNDVAYCYRLPQWGEDTACIIEKELSGFRFPKQTTTFLSPQATPQIGWMKTKPSYEERYVPDEALGTPSTYGLGYTFPALFHIGDDGWVLVSETGVDSRYCASHLSEATEDGLYSIAFPHPDENNSYGNPNPIVALPAQTPWRTLTVGESLKPIVETTVPFDLVSPKYQASEKYQYGRSTWSWIMWQDQSMNYEDQITYIDWAENMGYEYILMDALWDTQVGYDRMPDLINYAHTKGVDVFLWYNSNGYWNNAPQGPKHKMDNPVARKKEMQWLKDMGVKGLKVDFFGGDKQETMKLYEDIIADANEYGLMIIFHGCTLPRGWERMYPNYVGSEAVLASENLIFTQKSNDEEAFSACLHPFIRNAVGSMEFGPVLLNKRHNRTNDGGTIRRTTDIFQLATSVLYQSPVQMFAIAPNNLTDVPAFEIDFMKEVPTTWDETVFIDGYPGKYCIMARRHEERWYIVGVNAQEKDMEITVRLPMLSGTELTRYFDDEALIPSVDQLKVPQDGTISFSIQPNGGIILIN